MYISATSIVRAPSGNWTLSCSFENLPPVAERESSTGWLCSIIGAPGHQTHHSSWVRTTSGTAHLDCHFSGKPIADAVVVFGGAAAPAQQAAFTRPVGNLSGQQITGETASAGLACAPISTDLTGRVAIVERPILTSQKSPGCKSAFGTIQRLNDEIEGLQQKLERGGTTPAQRQADYDQLAGKLNDAVVTLSPLLPLIGLKLLAETLAGLGADVTRADLGDLPG